MGIERDAGIDQAIESAESALDDLLPFEELASTGELLCVAC